jgi:hypothetical protein
MGKHDSTKTRVAPIFDQLYRNDRTGHSWLGKLISLPTGGFSVRVPSGCDLTIEDCGWGDREKKLDPPVALLSWLIRHPRHPLSGNLSSDRNKSIKRKEWIAGSDANVLEGLALLRDNSKAENWHLFEGQTQPDVYIQTPSIILVIEGKRTERCPTTSTKWMVGRHQMLRHIDCAWEIAGKRKVVGFFVVEGEADSTVPSAWLDYARQTITEDAIRSSLSHRGPEEQDGIASCFAGVTTWQHLCEECNLDWAAMPK